MGYEHMTIAPAVVYTIMYTVFASVVAPFVGFFASGFKRATGIKDFAATLPGHGGIIDRVDCISLMSCLNYFFLTQVILKDTMLATEAYTTASKLLDHEKAEVLNTIAQRFNLQTI